LHLGSAASALVGWLASRSVGGTFVVRVEDIDTPRVRRGMEAKHLDDLRWLGLDWDEGPDVGGPFEPYRQSERTRLYDRALGELERRGLTYLCDCSRADIARVASAPHEGDEGPRYPGTCRERGHLDRAWKREPAVRLKTPDREIVLFDRWQGEVRENVGRAVGDFVLRRGDGVYAYQLAVVVDDLAMGITEVVRGVDLLSSAARQALLCEILGGQPPRYAHHPLVVSADGSRLAKRAGGVPLRDQRDKGRSSSEIVARLARALGLDVGGRPKIGPRDLLESFDPGVLQGRREARVLAME